jgi:hypothetical protein
MGARWMAMIPRVYFVIDVSNPDRDSSSGLIVNLESWLIFVINSVYAGQSIG